MHASRSVRSLLGACSVALGFFALKAAFLWTAPVRGLGMTPWILDDAFIIARVARNVGLGHGFTYDFVHATTGSPMLWTYLTSLNHMLAPTLETAMKLTFVETAFLGSLAALVVFAIVRKISDREEVAWMAFLLASLSGNAFFQSMNGMDTSLFTLCALGSFACAVGVGKPQRFSESTWSALTGLLVGITCLVRGDGIFVLAAIAMVECVEALRTPTQRGIRLRNLALLCSVALVCIGLLVAWQFVRTGSPMIGNQVGRRELALSLTGFDFAHFDLKRYLTIVAWNSLRLEQLVDLATGSAVFALFAILGGWLIPALRRMANVTLVYTAIFFGLLVTYQWYFPDLHGLRYVNVPAHLLFIFMAGCIASLPPMPWRKAASWTVVVAIILLSNYWFYDFSIHLGWAKGMSFFARPGAAAEEASWTLIDWSKAHLPAGTVIGVRDHGRFALFTDLPVQDIAGTVDPTVPVLARHGGLKAYLQERRLSYVILPREDIRKDFIYQVLRKDLSLSPVTEAPEGPGGTRLYKVRW